jgi:hypothetical protein
MALDIVVDDPPVDLVGVEIRVGDTIAFAKREGNCATLCLRKVLEVRCKQDRYYSHTHKQWVSGNIYTLSICPLNSKSKGTTPTLNNVLVLSRADGTKLI